MFSPLEGVYKIVNYGICKQLKPLTYSFALHKS